MRAPSAKKDRLALTVGAAGGVVSTLAIFNVAGWAVTWASSIWFALLFCGIALFSEFLGFNLAIAAEKQWQRGRKDRFAACLYCLIVCATVNVVSGHNAWDKFEHMMLEPARVAEQAGLDRERKQSLDQIVEIDRQLDAARPLPQSSVGPQARAEARQVYGMEIARLQPSRERLQRRLDQLPVVAPERHIIEPWVVWFAFALIEVMKALVLWGVGIGFEEFSANVRSAAAGAALLAQEAKHAQPPEERPQIIDPPLKLELALDGENGRPLLDTLVESNVVTMKDIASKHAARKRPGRAKATKRAAA